VNPRVPISPHVTRDTARSRKLRPGIQAKPLRAHTRTQKPPPRLCCQYQSIRLHVDAQETLEPSGADRWVLRGTGGRHDGHSSYRPRIGGLYFFPSEDLIELRLACRNAFADVTFHVYRTSITEHQTEETPYVQESSRATQAVGREHHTHAARHHSETAKHHAGRHHEKATHQAHTAKGDRGTLHARHPFRPSCQVSRGGPRKEVIIRHASLRVRLEAASVGGLFHCSSHALNAARGSCPLFVNCL
jgi:hypothetical protein